MKRIEFSIYLFLFLFCNNAFAFNLLEKETPGKLNAGFQFTENKGQVYDQHYNPRPDILYYGRNGAMNFFIEKNTFHYQFHCIDTTFKNKDNFHIDKFNETIFFDRFSLYRVDINLLNSNTNPAIVSENELSGYENFYLTTCPDGALNVKSFSNVRVNNIYEGIDLMYLFRDGELNYDFLVNPGHDYSRIKLQVTGADKIEKDEEGNIIIHTPLGKVIEGKPKVYQEEETLEADWLLEGNILSFKIHNANPNFPLLIDPPVRVWGTYYPGDRGYASTTDKAANVYLTGVANSAFSLMATSGAYQTTFEGETDAFLAKFDSSGARLWSTYYGGSGLDASYSCGVDTNDNVFMVGEAMSLGLASAGAFQTSNNNTSWSALLVKFNANGARSWATYYGYATHGQSCRVSKSGYIYMCGNTTSSANIATINAHQTLFAGGADDAFLVKFTNSGTRLWGTYFGGAGHELCYSGAVDENDNVFIAGGTSSSTQIASPNCHQSYIQGGGSGFLAKFDKNGNRVWSTYYGVDDIYACEVDGLNNIYIGGLAGKNFISDSLVTTPGTHKPSLSGTGSDAFLAKFDNNGRRLWGTYFGGDKYEMVRGIATDRNNNVYIAGYTESNNGIATQGAFYPYHCCPGSYASYLAKFSPYGLLEWGTYYGYNGGYNLAHNCHVDHLGNYYLIGTTASRDGIATPNSFQPAFSGRNHKQDPYIAKFLCSPSVPFGSIQGNDTVCSDNSHVEYFTTYAGTSYNWTVPNGATIDSGQGTNKIFVNLNGSSGLISVNAQEACGTSITQSLYVSIDSTKPTAFVSISADTICSGDEATFLVSGGLNYLWGTGETDSLISVRPLTNATYMLTVSDNACDTVIIIKLGVIQPDTSVTQNGDTIFANANNVTYQWMNCGNGLILPTDTNKSFTSALPGNYAVIINERGCLDTSACFTIGSLNSINNYYQYGFRIYPNPTNGVLMISADKLYEDFLITVYDVTGKLILSKKVTQSFSETLQINQPSGLYFVSITTNSSRKIFKVIKE